MAGNPADLVHRVARGISARRRALGLTQEALADRLELAVKNVQRIEAGAQNLTLATLERIARALETSPAALLGASTGEEPRGRSAEPDPIDELRAAGFRVRSASAPGRRAENAVPLTTITAAAGAITGSARALEALAWVTLPRKGPPPAGQFVARIQGQSMEPRIKHGSFCLFGPAGPPPYRSRIFLVADAAIADTGLEGPFALKQIAVRKREGRSRVTLVSLNPDFPPIVLDASDDNIRIVAELVDVLVPRSGSGPRRA